MLPGVAGSIGTPSSLSAAQRYISRTAQKTVGCERGHAETQAYPDRVFDQIDGLSRPGPLLIGASAGHQHREDLLLVLGPEGPGVARQQPPVASLKPR